MHDNPKKSPAQADEKATPPRRSFLAGTAAVIIGAVVGVVPLVSGMVMFLDPWRRGGKAGKMIRVAQLDALPVDGLPHRFPVVDVRIDKWNKYPPQPIDAVFLQRDSADVPPKAYSATCPHLGCSVDFKTDRNQYQCPCHNSAWSIDSARIRPESCPSPRDLDELAVEIRNGSEIWIDYKRFRSGIAAKEEA